MPVCAACGTDNPEVARFCLACGTPVAEAATPPREVRKVVTVVFSDLKGSTSLGESLDSEALREVMTRYFDAMRAELERHGGTLEKFIGDAVMAVFGLPQLHEDDALRAVRAAAGTQRALAEINDELDRLYGVRLVNRTGVNTGEVVAGDSTTGQRLVTGDVVNVAARLEQAAGESEVLIGDLTYRLVRDHVEVEPVEPLTLKGKAEPVPAYRLVGVHEAAAGLSRPATRLVGRDVELEQLLTIQRESHDTNGSRLAVLIGEPGVGKSRLKAEFIQIVSSEARVLQGRCLPYGDGITFWPLVEVVKSAAQITGADTVDEAYGKLEALHEDPGVIERVAAAIGLLPAPFTLEELFWGARRLLVSLAAPRPLVVVFEDIHWAEPTFLDLIEYIAAAEDAPLMLLCPARPELLETAPDFGTVQAAEWIVLQRLDAGATALVVEGLLEGASIDHRVLSRIVEATEGNPLFAEQMLSMMIDEGLVRLTAGRWLPTAPIHELHVPPTIQALLASRLDTLAPDERAVIEPAAVIGYHFPQPAVERLVSDRLAPRVAQELHSVSQKQFVSPAADAGDDVYRFVHILVRDTAYDGILKRARASLHEDFVQWADEVNGDRVVEYEEILGFHLEQAWKYLSELGPLDDHGRSLGADAARRLSSAGRRAFTRGDIPAAVSLLGRAAALLPVGAPERLDLLPDYGEALLMAGRFDEAGAVLDETIERSASAPTTAARATLVRLLVSLRTGDSKGWSPDAVERQISDAIAVFERAGDDAGLAMAWRLRAWSAGIACRFGDAAEAAERAGSHARRAGDVRQERRAATAYAAAASLGPTVIDEAIARCEFALDQNAGDRQSEGQILAVLAGLYAMQGTFDHARELVARGRTLFTDLGLDLHAARLGVEAWRVEMLAGDVAAAEGELRAAFDALEAVGEKYLLSTVAGLLGQTVLGRDAVDEAEALASRSRTLATDDDVNTQALWRCVHGRVLARRGLHDEAVEIVREALALLERTDATVLQFDANLDLGEVLALAGRIDEARAAYEAARAFADRKGGVVILGTVLLRLEALDTAHASR